LSTSNLSNEHQQTPLIFACKLQLLSIIHCLLEHKQCNILSIDYENNQAIHYYLQTSNRTNEYIDILNIFIKKLKLITSNTLNIKSMKYKSIDTKNNEGYTPLHLAVVSFFSTT